MQLEHIQGTDTGEIQTTSRWNPINTLASIDKHIEEITTVIASCLHNSCPTIKSRQGLIRISRGLLEKIKLKQDIQREIRQFPDYKPLRHAYRNIKKEIKTKLEEEKKAARMREVEVLNPKDSQQYWRTINNLTGQIKTEKKPIKLINSSTHQPTPKPTQKKKLPTPLQGNWPRYTELTLTYISIMSTKQKSTCGLNL